MAISFERNPTKQLSDNITTGQNSSTRCEPGRKAPKSKRKFEELKGDDHGKKQKGAARPRLTIKLRPRITIKLQPDIIRRALDRMRKQSGSRNGDIGEREIDDLSDAEDPSMSPAKKPRTEEAPAGLGDPASLSENTVPASAKQPRRWASTQQEIDESNARWIASNLNNAPWKDPDAIGPNEGDPVLGPVEVEEPKTEVQECTCWESETCAECRAFAEGLHNHFREWNAEVGWTWG